MNELRGQKAKEALNFEQTIESLRMKLKHNELESMIKYQEQMHQTQQNHLSDVQQLQQQLVAQQAKTREAIKDSEGKTHQIERLTKELESLKAQSKQALSATVHLSQENLDLDSSSQKQLQNE